MTNSATTEPAQPARPLPQVAFVSAPSAPYVLNPVRIDDHLTVVGVNTTVPDVDHQWAVGVMHLIIGDFEDITTQLFNNLDDTGLLVGIVDAAAEQSPRTGQDDWSAADRASDPLYGATSVLIEETVRRHIIGAHHDGIRPAVAARGILRALIAACHISADQYLQKSAVTR